MIELDEVLDDARSLEPLPASASRLASLLAGDSWDMQEVCGAVRLDEALTGRLLGVANSARSGAREQVGTVELAVMRLGTGAVLGVALGNAVRKNYQTALPAYGLDEGGLWRHSVATALAVEEMRNFGVRSVPPEAFSTALLHDVGKLVLARHLTPEVLEYLRNYEGADGYGFGPDVERAVLSTDHAALGAVVARAWGLQKAIADGIEHHERPLGARPDAGRYLALLVSCADAAAVQAGAMCGSLAASPTFTHMHAEGLGIGRKAFDELSLTVMKRLQQVLQAYE